MRTLGSPRSVRSMRPQFSANSSECRFGPRPQQACAGGWGAHLRGVQPARIDSWPLELAKSDAEVRHVPASRLEVGRDDYSVVEAAKLSDLSYTARSNQIPPSGPSPCRGLNPIRVQKYTESPRSG